MFPVSTMMMFPSSVAGYNTVVLQVLVSVVLFGVLRERLAVITDIIGSRAFLTRTNVVVNRVNFGRHQRGFTSRSDVDCV